MQKSVLGLQKVKLSNSCCHYLHPLCSEKLQGISPLACREEWATPGPHSTHEQSLCVALLSCCVSRMSTCTVSQHTNRSECPDLETTVYSHINNIISILKCVILFTNMLKQLQYPFQIKSPCKYGLSPLHCFNKALKCGNISRYVCWILWRLQTTAILWGSFHFRGKCCANTFQRFSVMQLRCSTCGQEHAWETQQLSNTMHTLCSRVPCGPCLTVVGDPVSVVVCPGLCFSYCTQIHKCIMYGWPCLSICIHIFNIFISSFAFWSVLPSCFRQPLRDCKWSYLVIYHNSLSVLLSLLNVIWLMLFFFSFTG